MYKGERSFSIKPYWHFLNSLLVSILIKKSNIGELVTILKTVLFFKKRKGQQEIQKETINYYAFFILKKLINIMKNTFLNKKKLFFRKQHKTLKIT